MDIFHLIACLLFPLSRHIYTFCRFSFEITPYGEILKVYHPKEDDEVLATKKGFAALLASKLRGKQQVSTRIISPSNENVNLLIRVKFLHLFI